MKRHCAWQVFGGVSILFLAATDPAFAQAQPTPANKAAPKPPPNPAPVAVVPFPVARGGPLHISIDGLNEGTSRVGAGSRLFGLCWSGGTPPYSVDLQNSNAHPLLQKNDIDGTDLRGNSEFVNLEAGRYDLNVSDAVGVNASGRFSVVPPSDTLPLTTAPGAGGDVLAQSSALVAEGSAFDYEAYLRLLGLSQDNVEAQRMRNDICHRPTEAVMAESPLNIPTTEVILADTGNLSSPEFAGAGLYYAYLMKQGAVLSEAIYEFETSSADNFSPAKSVRAQPQFVKASTSQIQLQQATTVLEYGVTDNLAVGTEISGIFETYKTTGSPTDVDSDWSDPAFLAVYRVADQSAAPVTAFLRSSYSPAIVRNGQQVIDMGGTIVRDQGNYGIAGVFDATYTGSSPTIPVPVKMADGTLTSTSVKLGADWRYSAALQSNFRPDDRWLVALAAGYEFSYDRNEASGQTNESVNFDGTPLVSSSASYYIIPDKLYVSLVYQHYFNSRYEETVSGVETGFTQTSGADVVSIVLSSSMSFDDIHLGF